MAVHVFLYHNIKLCRGTVLYSNALIKFAEVLFISQKCVEVAHSRMIEFTLTVVNPSVRGSLAKWR
jgi:hypothetical protein